MPRSIEAFIAGVDRSLVQDLAKGQTEPNTKRRVSSIVDQCGWKKRSPQRLHELEHALARADLYADKDLSDIDLGLDTWVRFTRRPPDTLGKVFRQERALGYHLGKYKSALEDALPQFAPLSHRHGGNKEEQTYYLGSESLRPDLVFKAATGEWVVCEVEKGDPDLESVPQLARYIEAVRQRTNGLVVGVLVTARPRTRSLKSHIEGNLTELTRRGERVAWIWYEVSIHLDVVFQP